MKKKANAILLLTLSACSVFMGCQKEHTNTVVNDTSTTVTTPTMEITNPPSKDPSIDQSTEASSQLTKEQKLEDFETLYEIIRDNYAFLDVNKRLSGIDWLSNKESYEKKVSETKNDDEFFEQLNAILGDLNNYHTCIMDRDSVLFYGMLFKSITEGQDIWQGLIYEEFCKPEVLKRYHLQVKDYETGSDTYFDGNYTKDNLYVNDIVEGKVACITIPQLISITMTGKDEKIVKEYLKKVKDYPALIIDIRGNGGGDNSYFTNFLYPMIIPKTMTSTGYLFYKNGSYVQKRIDYWDQKGWTAPLIKDLDMSKLPNLQPEVSRDFTYYDEESTMIEPAKDSINYQGHIYLLVDKDVFSASEAMAIFSKDSGLATLVGETTGGDGLGLDPMVAALPNSGLLLRFSADYGTFKDGSCDEEVKTQPDYMVEHAERTEDSSKDECIQKVLELEGLK